MNLRNMLFLLTLSSIAAGSMTDQRPSPTLANADVLNMTKSGIGEQTIITTIQKASAKFDSSPEALIRLNTAGVWDAVPNAMLNASFAPTVSPSAQDCSQTLDKVVASVGTPDQVALIESSKWVSKIVEIGASGTNTMQVERITMWSTASTHFSIQTDKGNSSTIVVAPEFNYIISGKITTSVPATTLQEIQSNLKLELIYIAQHRNAYGCTLDGTEQIGNVSTAKLKIKSDGVEGQFNADPTTGRLIRTTNLTATSDPISTDYSDWREVDGIYVSFKRHVVTKSATTDFMVSDYHTNVAIDPALFRPPATQVTSP
jgi:hypothetical protein